MAEFHYTAYAQDIYFGAGAIERLPQAAAAFGWQRTLLITTGSARRAGRAGQVEALLGQRWAATFDATQPHVPAEQVAAVADLARAWQAAALIALGGGSAIGLAKAASQALEQQPRAAFPTDQPRVPVAAIPTTYAGSEMTPVYGVTQPDGAGGTRKVTTSDPKIAPKLVIYDPALTLDLPPDLTAATGINALAHCLEAAYSAQRHPLSTAAALAGAGHIGRALPRCWADGTDLEARTEMLLGAHLAGTALATVSMGLHHGLCHVLGGAAGVPHGVANSIVLPHALRFNLEAVTPDLAQVAAAMGVVDHAQAARDPAAAAQATVDHVAQLIRGLALPTRLREAGVSRADFPRLAGLALQSRAVQSNPRRVGSVEEVLGVLEEAW
jgi:alcohol dehydrogenase class IV